MTALIQLQKEHDGRRLQWLYQLCKGEITMKAKRTHIFEVSVSSVAALKLLGEYFTNGNSPFV